MATPSIARTLTRRSFVMGAAALTVAPLAARAAELGAVPAGDLPEDSIGWHAEGRAVLDSTGHVVATCCNEDVALELAQARRALASLALIEWQARIDPMLRVSLKRHDLTFPETDVAIIRDAGQELI